MKNTRRKILSLLLALAMVLTVVPAGLMTEVFAAESVSYMDYDAATKTFTEKTIDTYNKVEASTTTLSGGWWVVDGTVETAGLTCSGDVNLILTDGSSLTVTGEDRDGIYSQYPIIIYSQKNNTGKLTVKATGYDDNTGQIGYSGLVIEKKLTLNGGNVSFIGASYEEGGNGYSRGGSGIESSFITVNGGNLSATGGYGLNVGGYGILCIDSFNVNGGNISATAGNGINTRGQEGIRASNITINGGTVKAVGGNTEMEETNGSNAGSGILAGAKLFINGGNVTAIGGTGQNNNNGSGIRKLNNNSVYIDKYCTVKADNNATPTTVIEHESDTNLASTLNGKQYVTVTEPDGTRITSDMVSDIPALTYSSAELEPAVIVTDGDETLVEDEDYSVAYRNNIDAGTATVTVNGIGDYYGEVVKEFTINKRSVTITSVSLSKSYDGEALTNHNAVITEGGFAGDEGATYSFTGSQTNAGFSDNTFTCKLNAGTKESNYDITLEFGTLTVAPKIITEEMIVGVDNLLYTSDATGRNVIVKDGDKTLVANTDYTFTYGFNTNAETMTVMVVGIGNYCEEATKTFKLERLNQDPPTNISHTDETKCSANDGTISGLVSPYLQIAFEDGEYEYCTGETMTGLAPGTYYIRYCAYNNYKASEPIKVVIEDGDCYGGKATCVSKANCDGCGNEYGEIGTHEWNDFYTVDEEPTLTEPGCKSIHCKHCDATKDSQPVLSLTDSFEEYKQATIEKLDSLITEHNSIISKIVVSFANFVIKRCDYDDTKSYEENIASVDKIAQDAINMINARHDFNYGCPFIRCIANIFDPCFVTARCFVHFVLIQLLKVL